jgi:hypothetical protein
MYDFKPAILFIGSLVINNINELLGSTVLGLNVIYISYQIYTHHKKNNDKNNNND